MVGETVGADLGGILNRGSASCPESETFSNIISNYWCFTFHFETDATPDWEYWHTMFGSWEEDWTLEAICEGKKDVLIPGPAPQKRDRRVKYVNENNTDIYMDFLNSEHFTKNRGQPKKPS